MVYGAESFNRPEIRQPGANVPFGRTESAGLQAQFMGPNEGKYVSVSAEGSYIKVFVDNGFSSRMQPVSCPGNCEIRNAQALGPVHNGKVEVAYSVVEKDTGRVVYPNQRISCFV